MKKFLKIVLGIMTLLFLIVVGIGLFVKETTYEVKTTVDKPIAEVFDLFNNRKNIKEWIPTIKSFEPIVETENKVGSKYKMVVNDNSGNNIEMIEEVLRFENNKNVSIQFDAKGMLMINAISFEEQNNKTKIVNNITVKGTNFMLKCILPFSKKMFQKMDQEVLEKFKNYAESYNKEVIGTNSEKDSE